MQGSTQNWRAVPLKLKARGMNIPELAISGGAMGFWAAFGRVPRNPSIALLDGHNHERTERPAEINSAKIWQTETRVEADLLSIRSRQTDFCRVRRLLPLTARTPDSVISQ